MVGIPPGGMTLNGHGRGIAHRPGVAASSEARPGGPAPSGMRGSPGVAAPPVTQPSPADRPVTGTGRIAWSPARLIATLLNMLTAAGASTLRGPDRLPQANVFPGQPATAQPGGDGAAQPRPGAGPQLVAVLLRVLAGPVTPDTAGTGPAPDSTSAEKAVEPAPLASQPRNPQETGAAIPRTDAPPLTAGSGPPAAAAPQPAPAAPGEQPAPRAELVPPGDGRHHRSGVHLPLVPAALVALALPALAAVLASIF